MNQFVPPSPPLLPPSNNTWDLFSFFIVLASSNIYPLWNLSISKGLHRCKLMCLPLPLQLCILHQNINICLLQMQESNITIFLKFSCIDYNLVNHLSTKNCLERCLIFIGSNVHTKRYLQGKSQHKVNKQGRKNVEGCFKIMLVLWLGKIELGYQRKICLHD